MERAAEHLRPVFKELRPMIAQDLRSHFEQGDGDGEKWPPLAPSTVQRLMPKRKAFVTRGARAGAVKARYARRVGNILGKLKSAWIFTITDKMIEARSRSAVWGWVHNEGGTAGRGSRIPKRTFAWFRPWLVAHFQERVIARLMGAWR
jgi:hypothetical protein